jgi:ribosomal protein S18 acetylase RimI-like enzyme
MIAIREATERDYLKLVEIMSKSADKEELNGFVPPTSETRKFLMRLRQQLGLAGHRVFVAEVGQKPVGFLYFTKKKDNFAIEELDVAKKHQGRGIGRALVKAVEKLAKEKGAISLTAGTAINSEGLPWKAYGFWIRMGYTDTGEITDSGYGFKYCRLVKKLE